MVEHELANVEDHFFTPRDAARFFRAIEAAHVSGHYLGDSFDHKDLVDTRYRIGEEDSGVTFDYSFQPGGTARLVASGPKKHVTATVNQFRQGRYVA